MGLGGEGEPWYVVGKDIRENIVWVERGVSHPALFSPHLTAREITWIQDIPSFPYSCSAKIRYRQTTQNCTLYSESNGQLRVIFDEPQRAITPGQSVVFYDRNVCLGGGLIC